MDLLEQVIASSDDVVIDPLPEPLTKAEVAILKAIRNELITLAEATLIPQEFLFSKKDIELILRGAIAGRDEWPQRFITGWRESLVTPIVKKALSEQM